MENLKNSFEKAIFILIDSPDDENFHARNAQIFMKLKYESTMCGRGVDMVAFSINDSITICFA